MLRQHFCPATSSFTFCLLKGALDLLLESTGEWMSPVKSSISDISSGKPSVSESQLLCFNVSKRGRRFGLEEESEQMEIDDVVALLSSKDSLREPSELLTIARPSAGDTIVRSSALLTGAKPSSSCALMGLSRSKGGRGTLTSL